MKRNLEEDNVRKVRKELRKKKKLRFKNEF